MTCCHRNFARRKRQNKEGDKIKEEEEKMI
jgi:hypothetical protein